MIALLVAALVDVETLRLERDDARIERAGAILRIEPSTTPIVDANGDGVLHVVADDVVLDFAGAELRGAGADLAHDRLDGVGIRVLGKRVTVRNAKLRGFKCAIWATGADGLTIEGCSFEDNFRQRLRSTPKAEHADDWLWPHENDRDEWRTKYGAAIYVDRAVGVTVRGCRARAGQNGLLLRAVEDSLVIDNDFSFLSGWGIALYRSSRNRIQNNACDFCVRGYSHGVYARGQDSAGILCFEQNHENVFAHNSATHSGDGFFGYAGNECLDGGVQTPRAGNRMNLLYRNDFSYAPAIGIEMTFSFDNAFVENRLVGGNYGIWGGYSHDTHAIGNEIAQNAIAGIAIEHGTRWTIERNRFRENAKGIELWWDDDKELLSKPWSRMNRTDSAEHRIAGNRFDHDAIGIELRRTIEVVLGGGAYPANEFVEVGRELVLDEHSSRSNELGQGWLEPGFLDARLATLERAKTTPVGARAHLAGRGRIVMTEWGPYDWETPYLRQVELAPRRHVYELLGHAPLSTCRLESKHGRARVEGQENALSPPPSAPRIVVLSDDEGATEYELWAGSSSRQHLVRGWLLPLSWRVGVFPCTADPRSSADAWAADRTKAHEFELDELSLPYGSAGLSELANVPQTIRDAKLPRDHFGTVATSSIGLPMGNWRVRTTSDDGIRVHVRVGDQAERVLIEDWTHHAPKTSEATFTVVRAATVTLRVEHFELDGHATLSVELENADDAMFGR